MKRTRDVLLGALAVLVSLSACTQESTTPANEPTGQVVLGVVSGGTLTVYISDKSLSDANRAAIDLGERIGMQWIRLRLPYGGDETAIDLSRPAAAASVAQEWTARHPVTREITNFRIDLAAGEPGLSGWIKVEPVESGRVNVMYSADFDGMKNWYDPTVSAHLFFSSSNAASIAPEVLP